MPVLLIVLLALAGCPLPPHPLPPTPTPPESVEICAADVRPVTADVCQSSFTVQNRPCARCVQEGCWDALDAVYCVVGDCLDPACHLKWAVKR